MKLIDLKPVDTKIYTAKEYQKLDRNQIERTRIIPAKIGAKGDFGKIEVKFKHTIFYGK
jgi:hypothetical protein